MVTEVKVGAEPIWAEQDSGSELTYTFDLAPMLPAGDTIAASVWSVTPGGGASVLSSSFNGTKVTVKAGGGTPNTWYMFKAAWQSAGGVRDEFVLRLFIKANEETISPLGSALFPNRFTATRRLASDRLMLAAKAAMPKVTPSDDYLWDKLRSAESEVAHTLRVPLTSTRFFPQQPAQADIDALAGRPWAIDPGYDYRADFFRGESFGLIKLRNKPLIAVQRIRFAYPSPATEFFDIPTDWVRMDAKYGTIQLVPSTATFSAPLSAFFMQAIGGGRTIPFMTQVTYDAGLENAAGDYPELVDAVMKTATLKILEDAFLPSSGSISADGFSQSLSMDMEKHHESIDRILMGPKGSNGGLMTAIHGIQFGVA